MNRSCGKLLKLPHKINYCCTHLPSLKPLACEQALRDALAVGQEKEGCFLVLRKLLFVSFCVVVWVLFSVFSIFCITSLVSATPRNHQKEGELATTSLEFEFHFQFPCGSPSTELSDFHQSEQSGNERECTQTLKNMCEG